MKQIVIAIIALVVVSLTAYAYAELDQNEVPFDFDFKSCTRSTLVTEAGEFDAWYCTYLGGIPVGATIEETMPENGQPTIEITIEEEPEIIAVEKPKPLTMNEKKILELEEKLAEEGELVSHEDQLLKALLSYQDDCELGTEQGAPIQDYELFTIATFEPYTHTDLGTQYILKQIELAIQECKSQQILKTKILGEQYLHIPSTNQPKIIYQTNATLPDHVQAKYDEAKMSDYFAQKTIDTAEGFQCSILGKQQGHCVKKMSDMPVQEPTISQAGKAMLSKYNAYQATGIADIPVQEQAKQLTPLDILKQYMKAYDIKASDLED